MFLAINLLVSNGLCFLLLYERRKPWCTAGRRWKITGALVIAGAILSLFDPAGFSTDGYFFLIFPIIYNLLDRCLKTVAIKRYGRDFYLYLSHSADINSGWNADNPHIKGFDMLFSFLLLGWIMGLYVMGALLLHSMKA